jgi:hypothetical protein
MKKNLTGFLLLLFLIQGALHGQISGTVTISSSNTATTANFKNWYSFWRNLQGLSRSDGGPSTGAGVSGPVTVSVTSDLLESQTIDFASISGASSTNTITINGNNKVVEYSGNYEVMRFCGADYLKIQNLTIRHSGSRASRSTCVRFFNGSDYNSIISCTLEFSGLNSIATDGSAILLFPHSTLCFRSLQAPSQADTTVFPAISCAPPIQAVQVLHLALLFAAAAAVTPVMNITIPFLITPYRTSISLRCL